MGQPPSAEAVVVRHPYEPQQDPRPLASNLLSFAVAARRSTSQIGMLPVAVLKHTTQASFDSSTAEAVAGDIGSFPYSERPLHSPRGMLVTFMGHTDFVPLRLHLPPCLDMSNPS